MYDDHTDGCRNGREFYVMGACGHGKRIAVGCNNRFESNCPVCARKWRARVRARYAAAVKKFVAPKFLTLTMKKYRGVKVDEERFKGLWALRKSAFRRLHDDGYEIRAWVAVCELPNHIHLIIDSVFIPQWKISEVWHSVTGDSYVCDIRAITTGRDGGNSAVAYVTKYITKASAFDGVNLDLLSGFHLVGSHGLVHEDAPLGVCPYCGWEGHFHKISEEHYYACNMDDGGVG